MTASLFLDLFGAPQRLFLLIGIIPLSILLFRQMYAIALTRSKLLLPEEWKTAQNNFFSKQTLRSICIISAYIGLVIAISLPRWGTIDEPASHKSRDLLVLLDISRSMAATDIVPDRLRCAKAKIQRLLEQLPTERVGLVLFAGSPFIQVPLTVDHAAFSLFLDAVDTKTVSAGSTHLDKVLAKGIELYERMGTESSKLILLITDGEDFSPSLTPVRMRAKQAEVTILILGMGTPQGAPIPTWDSKGTEIGFEKDASGNPVLSKRNDRLLGDLARETGGTYVPVTIDDTDIEQLCNIIKKFEATENEITQQSRLHEQYAYPLMITFTALIIDWILS